MKSVLHANRRRMRLSVPTRLALFYGAMFGVTGFLLPYWPVWLASRGMGSTEIGILLSVHMWVKVVANPLVGAAADRIGDCRRPMIMLATGTLIGFALFPVADGFAALFAVSLLCGFLYVPLMPLGETLAVGESYARQFDYGRVRLWGSLTFIGASVLGGTVLERHGQDSILWLVWLGLACTVISCLLLPRQTLPRSMKRRVPLSRLLRNRLLLLFLAGTSLLNASHVILYGFGTLHWQSLGFDGRSIGWLWAIGVIAEILLFVISGLAVRHLRPAGLLAAAGLAGTLRWLVTGATDAYLLLAAMQVLHAFTFGAAHLGAMHFIARAVPKEMTATVQSLYAATSMGIISGIAFLAAGPLYAALAGQAYYVMAGLSAAGCLVATLLARGWDGSFVTR